MFLKILVAAAVAGVGVTSVGFGGKVEKAKVVNGGGSSGGENTNGAASPQQGGQAAQQ